MTFTPRGRTDNTGEATSDCGHYVIGYARNLFGKWWCNAWYHKDQPDQKYLAGTFIREEAIQACVEHALTLKNLKPSTNP